MTLFLIATAAMFGAMVGGVLASWYILREISRSVEQRWPDLGNAIDSHMSTQAPAGSTVALPEPPVCVQCGFIDSLAPFPSDIRCPMCERCAWISFREALERGLLPIACTGCSSTFMVPKDSEMPPIHGTVCKASAARGPTE